MNRLLGNPVSRLLSTRHPVVLLIFALIAAMTMSAAGTLAQEGTPTVTGVPDPTVRFVHASPDAPALNILIDGQPIAEGVAFGAVTEYAALSPGDHQIQVTPADGGAPIVDQTISLGGWASYILAATGQLADLQLQFNEVDVSQTAPGQARMRILNAVPDAQTVGLGVAGSEELMVDGAEFGAVSGYQNVTPGTYDLELRASDTGETLVLAPGVRIDAGQVYDVVALGEAAGGTIQILPLITPVAGACGETLGIGQATDSCLRVIHAGPDAGPIDVYIGDAPIVEGLEYGQASDFAATAHWPAAAAGRVGRPARRSGDH